MKNQFFKQFCDKVISVHNSIRFAAIVDEEGRLLCTSLRKGIKPLLGPEERAQYAITAATRQYTRLRWEYLLGRIIYASSHYNKLIRATLPITDYGSHLSYVLLLSFDVNTQDIHQVIMKKVIPLVIENKNALLKKGHL
jgi:hypothetical protein